MSNRCVMRHVHICLTCTEKQETFISFVFFCFFHTGNSFVVSHIKRNKSSGRKSFVSFLFYFHFCFKYSYNRQPHKLSLFLHSNQYIQHKRKSTTNKKTYRYTKNVLEVEEFLSIEKHFPVKRINIIRSGV